MDQSDKLIDKKLAEGRALIPAQVEVLESIIDRSSFSAVLAAMRDIAWEKADHVRAHWQDETTAAYIDKDR